MSNNNKEKASKSDSKNSGPIKPSSGQVYHKEDLEYLDRGDWPKEFFDKEADGWEYLGNGGYWKQIPGADI